MSTQTLSLNQWLGLPADEVTQRAKQLLAALRVALPCIVQSFDSATQTISAIPGVAEKIYTSINGTPTPTDFVDPKGQFVLAKIPVCWYGAGDFLITVPPQAGDECLIVFSDICIDSWWQNGGKLNVMSELRRHSWSDGVAILGLRSQPRLISNFNTSGMEVRNTAGSVKMTVTDAGITFTGPVTFQEPVTMQDDCTISGIDFVTHVHSGVQSGAADTGPPL